jgi:extracellular elastinolytic metalloproteinase
LVLQCVCEVLAVKKMPSAARAVPARRSSRPATRCFGLEPVERRLMLAAAASEARPRWMTDTYLPATQFVSGPAPTPGVAAARGGLVDPAAVATAFLRDSLPVIAKRAGAFGTLVTAITESDLSGVTHVYMRPTLNGLPVVNMDFNVNVGRDGSVLSAGGALAESIGGATLVTRPTLTAEAAIRSVARTIGLNGDAVRALSTRSTVLADAARTTTFSNPGLSKDAIEAELVYVLTPDRGPVLAWHTTLRTPDGAHWYELAVNAQNGKGGEVLFASDYTDHASYAVYPLPTEAPNDGSRAVVTDPQDALASPYGWHDTNGVAGAEFTITRGNNTNAYLDRNADNVIDAGSQPDGGASLVFNPTLDLTQAPTVASNQQSAVVNLFYLTNSIHDISYKYGFTESAGNFQVNNYGRGGTGNDPVLAEAQDGSGTDNANMSTPADGSSPRMQMYLFTLTSPQRDGDLDALVVLHEFTHGISNRLTGGPANASALTATQSGGMGEGWSDWVAMMLTQKSTDTQNGAYGVGTYVLGQATSGAGIRRQRYSYDMSVNTQTIALYNSSSEVHNAGELWVDALWDMNWLLINKYGFEQSLSNGYNSAAPKGNALAMQLVFDGMKLQPANPTFKQARDAILQADVNLTGGANKREIWQAFARRGMGYSFDSGASASATSVTPAFDLPPQPDPKVNSITPTSPTYGTFSSIDITFNEAMNPASFSLASDVTFTGPSGNALGSVTGTSWLNPSTLRLSVSPLPAGTYTIAVGPQILAADNGAAMDQNGNGVVGEADDGFSSTIVHTPATAADGFGYRAGKWPLQNINLVIGGTGVTTLINASDDNAAGINLGTNTFNYYGTTYTGSTGVYASANGLITFGSANTTFSNTDLTSVPPQAALAVLWDDWRTDVNVGTTDSAVLTQISGNWLIVEWSDIANRASTDGSATFQAMLELNTGSRPGQVIFNYPDIVTTNPTYTLGASSTVGIKATGTQGANRLLIAQDATVKSPLVADASAIRISTDWTPPRVTNVWLDGTAWAAGVRSRLATDGAGSATLGYRLPAGASTQLRPLPWNNVNRFSVQFSEAVSATVTDAVAAGINNAGYPVSGVSYDAANNIATFTLSSAAPADKLTLTVKETIRDVAGLPLDGDFTNPADIGVAGPSSLPTGDGFYGVNLALRVNALPGDVDGSGLVDKYDLFAIRPKLNTTSGDGNYSPFADVNADGAIDGTDYNFVVGAIGVGLPLVAGRPPAAPRVDGVTAGVLSEGSASPLASTATVL